jgi:hypothetical protein
MKAQLIRIYGTQQKTGRPQINNLTLHLKLEKQEQAKMKLVEGEKYKNKTQNQQNRDQK